MIVAVSLSVSAAYKLAYFSTRSLILYFSSATFLLMKAGLVSATLRVSYRQR